MKLKTNIPNFSVEMGKYYTIYFSLNTLLIDKIAIKNLHIHLNGLNRKIYLTVDTKGEILDSSLLNFNREINSKTFNLCLYPAKYGEIIEHNSNRESIHKIFEWPDEIPIIIIDFNIEDEIW